MNSLHRRLTVVLLAGLAVVLTAAVAGSYTVTRHHVLAEFDYALLAKARALTALPEPNREGISLNFTEDPLPEFQPGPKPEYFQVWLADGSPISKSPSFGETNLPFRIEAGHAPHYHDVRLPEGRRGRAVYLGLLADGEDPQAKPAFWLAFARDRVRLDRALSGLLLGLILAGLLLMVFVSALVRLTVRHSLHPIRKLTSHVTGIGAENLNRRFPAASLPTELRPVGEQLNRLMSRLQSAFERERRFSANAAHELLTPIAELHALAEVSLQNPEDAEHSLARDSLEIADQMQCLVDNLLALTRAHSGQAQVHAERVDLSALVSEALEIARGKLHAKSIQWQSSLDPDVVTSTDPALMKSILTNLVENAAEYTPASGRMVCRLSKSRDDWSFVLRNTNPGLDEDDLEQLFEPLWRKDAARTNRWHAGIGLSLVKALAERLDLTVTPTLTDNRDFQIEVRTCDGSRGTTERVWPA